MKVMKQQAKLFIVILISLCHTALISAETEKSVIIKKFEAVELQQALSVVGRLEVEGDMVYLVSNEGERLGGTALEQGLKISFEEIEEQATGVETVKSRDISFSTSSDIITIEGLKNASIARIYYSNGQVALKKALRGTETEQINISQLKAGVYILQIETQIFKLIKK